MTREDINDIISAICPNDEDYEKPCISPKYLRQELEQLALDQQQWNEEPTTKNDLGVDCISRAEVLKLMQDNWHTHNGDWAMQESMDDIRALPSVTPQEPKSEWQKDHEILKAYSDGANEVLDKIRADLYKLYNDRPSDYNHSQRTELFCEVIKILDKYTAESAHDVAQDIAKNNGIVDL